MSAAVVEQTSIGNITASVPSNFHVADWFDAADAGGEFQDLDDITAASKAADYGAAPPPPA